MQTSLLLDVLVKTKIMKTKDIIFLPQGKLRVEKHLSLNKVAHGKKNTETDIDPI